MTTAETIIACERAGVAVVADAALDTPGPWRVYAGEHYVGRVGDVTIERIVQAARPFGTVRFSPDVDEGVTWSDMFYGPDDDAATVHRARPAVYPAVALAIMALCAALGRR